MKNSQIKRRAFLSCIVGALIGVPVVLHRRRRKSLGQKEKSAFEQDFQKYHALTDVPVEPLTGQEVTALSLVPPIGRQWRYVLFSPSLLPDNMTQAVGEEPDVFLVREGNLFIDRTVKGQTVVTGGDSVFDFCSPTSTEHRERNEVTLLVKDDRLVPARAKSDRPSAPPDDQFQHLLALQNRPAGPLAIGTKWTAETGRVKPFGGFTTDYEVVGLAEVANRKTVNIAFSGLIPNMANLPGFSNANQATDVVVRNEHRGNAWFDLETGFLVRQEAELTSDSFMTESAPPMTVRSKFIVQLFQV